MTQTDKMLSRKEGGVGIVTFNNPERHNAVSLDMWEATKRILDDFAADTDIRAVVLTGAGGKAFVSGADISKFESERANLEAERAYGAKSEAAYASIHEFPKPTIAMIRGYCIGGGLGLATSSPTTTARKRGLMFRTCSTCSALSRGAFNEAVEAADPARCDEIWADLTRRFLPGIAWSGLDHLIVRGWRDVLHIMTIPFYIIEYSFAQLGAVQVWTNAQRDQREAVRLYRQALSLGGTRSLPDLFAAAGARFAFDEQTLRDAVQKIEETMAELENQ